ncbi:unnamed protein product [Rotaria socialis]|uniref:Uncharacterized protein n=1 Tax=Rotaria socialis TaxID=392032 RepID=A0A818E306_9BILA|nr:unnamed protein product [Rotaria socialis]
MSPTCMIKPKQSMHQQKSKSKSLKHKLNQDIEESIMVTRKKHENEEYLYVELDTKCSCLQSKFLCDSSIQQILVIIHNIQIRFVFRLTCAVQ